MLQGTISNETVVFVGQRRTGESAEKAQLASGFSDFLILAAGQQGPREWEILPGAAEHAQVGKSQTQERPDKQLVAESQTVRFLKEAGGLNEVWSKH